MFSSTGYNVSRFSWTRCDLSCSTFSKSFLIDLELPSDHCIIWRVLQLSPTPLLLSVLQIIFTVICMQLLKNQSCSQPYVFVCTYPLLGNVTVPTLQRYHTCLCATAYSPVVNFIYVGSCLEVVTFKHLANTVLQNDTTAPKKKKLENSLYFKSCLAT